MRLYTHIHIYTHTHIYIYKIGLGVIYIYIISDTHTHTHTALARSLAHGKHSRDDLSVNMIIHPSFLYRALSWRHLLSSLEGTQMV